MRARACAVPRGGAQGGGIRKYQEAKLDSPAAQGVFFLTWKKGGLRGFLS
jgi:hypothetical protein